MKIRFSKALWGVSLLFVLLACNLPFPSVPATPTKSVVAPSPTATIAPASATVTPVPEPLLRVVYAREGNLWLYTAGLPPQQLTAEGDANAPLFSPDGQQVLFQRELPSVSSAYLPLFSLWVVAVDGSGARQIFSPQMLPDEIGKPPDSEIEVIIQRLPYQIAWLPDGKSVAFNTFLPLSYGLSAYDDLWLVDVETGVLTAFLPTGEGGIFSFSPDGSHVALATATSLSIVRVDGVVRQELLTFDAVNTASEYAYKPRPAWSPDGAYIYAAISSAEPFGTDPSVDLWRFSLQGDSELLAALPGEFLYATQQERGLWSADFTHSAYLSPWVAGAERDLLLADSSGLEPDVYAAGVYTFLGWMSDSEYFLFSQESTGNLFLGTPGDFPQRLVPSAEVDAVVSVDWAKEREFIYLARVDDAFVLRHGDLDAEHITIDILSDNLPPLFDVYVQ